jgi:Protein of unknown function (DUF4238)
MNVEPSRIQTEFNHYSPVFTNQHWADDHGAIIGLRRGAGGNIEVSRTGPRKWGGERLLYPKEVEDKLGSFENRVAIIYDKLLRAERLNPQERLLWSRWILCQFARTPTFLLELAGFEEDVFSQFPEFGREFSFTETQATIDASVANISTFEQSDGLIPFIILRDWLILRPADGEFFIKGDVPVVIRGALVDDRAQIVYPLSPTHCFVATVLQEFPPRQIQHECRLKPGKTAQYIRLAARCAEREVICHPKNHSESLELLVRDVIGTSPRYMKHGTIPDW